MDTDSVTRSYLESQRRLHERLDDLRLETEAVLSELENRRLSADDVARLDGLLSERRKLFEEYQSEAGTLVQLLRRTEQENRKAEVAEKRASMPSKSTKTPASQSEIEKLSQELTTKLRTDRIDDAIKELLAFLADAEFFAANTSRGRRTKLRQLQNAIEKALAK